MNPSDARRRRSGAQARRSASSRPAPETLLDRRRFLALAGGAVAYSALRPHLAWAQAATGRSNVLQPWTLPAEAPAGSDALARALIGAAVLAPSDWNSQPWRFEVEGSSIRIVADPRRAMPVTDPDRRGMMVSLGAALENLLIAARAWGLRATVDYEEPGSLGTVARVDWSAGDLKRDLGLFESIPRRRTNRRKYDGRGLTPAERSKLMAQVPEGFELHWIEGRKPLRALAELVEGATREQLRDALAQAEQYAWIRFDGEEKRRGDGVPVDALEVGVFAGVFASRYYDPRSMFFRFGREQAIDQARDQTRSAGAMALLCGRSRDTAHWLMGGQTFERLALTATGLGIAHQPLSAPIERPRWRSQLLRAFGAAAGEPLALLRLGHAKRPDPTPRRSVQLVASFRNT